MGLFFNPFFQGKRVPGAKCQYCLYILPVCTLYLHCISTLDLTIQMLSYDKKVKVKNQLKNLRTNHIYMLIWRIVINLNEFNCWNIEHNNLRFYPGACDGIYQQLKKSKKISVLYCNNVYIIVKAKVLFHFAVAGVWRGVVC